MDSIKSLLFVDDSQSDQIIAQTSVETFDSSISLHFAYDGQEALELLASLDIPPDVIFLDINMPGMDGLEFLSEYSKTEANPSITVMMTTSDQDLDKERCLAYSFVKDYVLKPLESDDLAEIAKQSYMSSLQP